MLVAHRHPVVLMFCQLLIESNKVTTSEEKRKQLLRNLIFLVSEEHIESINLSRIG